MVGEGAPAAPPAAPPATPIAPIRVRDDGAPPAGWSTEQREAFARRAAKHATKYARAIEAAMERLDLWCAAPMTLG